MTDFSVWAPIASSVDLMTDGGRSIALEPDVDGWFRLAHDPGTISQYGFRLDGGPILPDPRSRWQPNGVDGPSTHVDLSSFAWTDESYRPVALDAAVLYEMHVGTFTPEGTYTSALDRLEHLVDLGVTHVELMPVAMFAGEFGWGYDGVFLYAPHPPYGTPAELQAFVDRCHACDLGVILDVVYNHLGPTGNHLASFGPYFSDRHTTPWGTPFDLDGPSSGPVRDFLLDNICLWLLDYHVDGLRFDALHAVIDDSPRHIFDDFVAVVDACGDATDRPRLAIVEFDDNRNDLVLHADRGGHGFAAKWNDDLHHAVHTALTAERSGYYADFEGLADVAACLERGWVYDGRCSVARDREHGEPFALRSGESLVAYLQNHDQVGNRPGGRRLGTDSSWQRQAIGSALVLLSPFVPMIFQGEEWRAESPFPYFADHADPALAAAVRDGRARELAAFGFAPEDSLDPCDPATVEAARLDWSELDEPGHAAMLEWYRTLLRLRRSNPELAGHDLDAVRVYRDERARVLLVHRGAFTIAVNLGSELAGVMPMDRSADCVVLASSAGPLAVVDDAVLLPAESVAVLRVGNQWDSTGGSAS